ncbi:MAG: SulP family inorganic anion transporter [Eubacteriales bacterium]|nr:SulP family inorganic anion transporter [Eubacteriales bacterium]
MRLLTQLSNNHKEKTICWHRDISAGIVVALVSIPISMGYAGIAGLPVVYGLYGSLLPILVFGLLTTSPQFVIGVDAMPAAMVGSLLAEFGIAAESEEALGLVPFMALLVACWFLVFYVLKAGRVVRYISTPVMGGFISGVGLTIILMQLPKLFGGSAGTGELPVLLRNILQQSAKFHWLSAVLGFGTILIIQLFKRIDRRIPMTVIMMGVGALLQVLFHLDRYGVKLLPTVERGLPQLHLPEVNLLVTHGSTILARSLSIALVIMAQTLLATGNYAMRYQDEVDNNKELLAYAAMNAVGGLVGCCPINGSVSRTGIADQFGCRSQVMSVTASITMLLVLLFGTPLLGYLPVPVLTGIVITALIGILEIPLAKKLWKAERRELLIFVTACAGVLLFGTVNGVLIGIVLSFAEVVMHAVVPPTTFIGRIPGKGNYYTIGRNRSAQPIQGAVIYRFGGNLFFANIDRFQADIENAIQEDTKAVVVDGRAIGRIDYTAAERLVLLYDKLHARGVRFYLAEHAGSVNDELRRIGGERLIQEGAVRRTITLALRDAGFAKPYILADGICEVRSGAEMVIEHSDKLAEFEWAFGKDAQKMMEQMSEEIAEEAMHADHLDAIDEKEGLHTSWGRIGLFDENEFLDHLEMRLEDMRAAGRLTENELERIERQIETRRLIAEERLQKLNPKALELLAQHRSRMMEHFRQLHPIEFQHVEELQEHLYEELKKNDPQLALRIRELHEKKDKKKIDIEESGSDEIHAGSENADRNKS